MRSEREQRFFALATNKVVGFPNFGCVWTCINTLGWKARSRHVQTICASAACSGQVDCNVIGSTVTVDFILVWSFYHVSSNTSRSSSRTRKCQLEVFVTAMTEVTRRENHCRNSLLQEVIVIVLWNDVVLVPSSGLWTWRLKSKFCLLIACTTAV